MGKHEHFKVKGFWNFLLEADIHAVPNTWEMWIPIIREKYGKKTNIPKFLKYFGWKNMWKHKHFKVKFFWNISLDAEIHAVPKIWEKWISIIQEKHEKTQTFQIYGFLNYFEWSRNSYNSQNMETVNSHSKRKIWKSTNILR